MNRNFPYWLCYNYCDNCDDFWLLKICWKYLLFWVCKALRSARSFLRSFYSITSYKSFLLTWFFNWPMATKAFSHSFSSEEISWGLTVTFRRPKDTVAYLSKVVVKLLCVLMRRSFFFDAVVAAVEGRLGLLVPVVGRLIIRLRASELFRKLCL